MARKKNNRRRRRDEDDEDFEVGLSQETKNGIWSIVVFGIAIISLLALFEKAGAAGVFYENVIRLLFGWGVWVVPVALILLGVAFLRSLHREIHISVIVGTFLFLLSTLAIFYSIGDANLSTDLRVEQGGYLGLVLGFLLLKYAGFTATFVVLVMLLIVSILVVLDISLYSLIKRKDKKDASNEENDEEDEDEEEEEEEDEDEEEEEELKDKVVIRRGSEVLDQKAIAKQKAQAAAKAKAQKPEPEFVIKSSKSRKWTLPPLDFLNSDSEQPRAGDINGNVAVIKRTLSHFGINVEMGEVSIGPSVTQFTLRPAVGVKLSRITALNKDLALALAASSIRIEAPIPGKSLVGIEIPNAKSAVVGLRDMIESAEFKKSKTYIPLAVGRDVAGYPVIAGLDKMPHLLIAGATGSGKSVTINTFLLSMLYRHSPDTLKLILVDPKRVELSLYNGIPHLITPVIVDTKKVINALRWAVREMEKRYEKMSEQGSRDILSYNSKQSKAKEDLMPYIVIVIDELADLMAAHGRDVEGAIVRLAQMARAVGIHLVVSTQRPSVEVITGLIKANIPARIALQVASQIDSRTILDSAGAEKLLGNGDMLYLAGSTSGRMSRVQGALVSEEEVKAVVKFIVDQAEDLEEKEEEGTEDELRSGLGDSLSGNSSDDEDAGDELFADAKQVVTEAGKASASLLQRRLRVGYARAARLLDLLEERGLIGPGEGAKPREVYMDSEGNMDNPNDDLPDQDDDDGKENDDEEEDADEDSDDDGDKEESEEDDENDGAEDDEEGDDDGDEEEEEDDEEDRK